VCKDKVAPLVKGGQGRSDAEMMDSLVNLGIVLGIVIVVILGALLFL